MSSLRALLILSAALAIAAGGFWTGQKARAQGGLVFFSPVLSVGAISPGNMVKWIDTNRIADGGTLDQMSFTQPSTGFNQVIPDGIRFYIVGNNALLATGTLVMPPNPADAQRVASRRHAVYHVRQRGADALRPADVHRGRWLWYLDLPRFRQQLVQDWVNEWSSPSPFSR